MQPRATSAARRNQPPYYSFMPTTQLRIRASLLSCPNSFSYRCSSCSCAGGRVRQQRVERRDVAVPRGLEEPLGGGFFALYRYRGGRHCSAPLQCSDLRVSGCARGVEPLRGRCGDAVLATTITQAPASDLTN